MNGWFPRINAAGAIASGNAGIWLTDASGSRQVSQVGIGPIWAGQTLIYNRNDGTTQIGADVLPIAYNGYQGSEDDRWAGFLAPGVGRVDIYHGTARVSETEAICSLRFGGTKIAYLNPYQPGPSEQRNLVIDNIVVASGRIGDVQLSRGGEFYVYVIATGTYTRAILDAQNKVVSIRDDEIPMIAFVGPAGEPWMMTGTQVGAFVRPVDSPFGYRIEGDLYYPDARMIDGRLRVVGSLDNGTPRFDEWIDFSVPRVDLRPHAPEPPDPEPPDPEPPDPPTPEPPDPPDPPTPLPPPGPFRLATGVIAMSPIRAGLRLGQFFASVDRTAHPFPGWFGLKFTDATPVEAFSIVQPQAGNPKLLIRPESVPGAALSADATEYSGDISSEFGVKPNVSETEWGGYEAWNGWQLGGDGISIVLVEYDRDGAKYTSACLTVVVL